MKVGTSIGVGWQGGSACIHGLGVFFLLIVWVGMDLFGRL